MTEIDRRIHEPPPNVPLLEWWDGIYDRVFIAPNPFYRLPTEDSLRNPDSPRVYEEKPVNWNEEPGETWKALQERVKQTAEPVRWSEVHAAMAPDVDRRLFNRAVWYASDGIRREEHVTRLADEIWDYGIRERLNVPDAWGLDGFTEPVIGRFLSSFGVETVTAWCVLRKNSAIYPLSDFGLGRPRIYEPYGWLGEPGLSVLHVPDPGILMCWGWDAVAGTFAITERALQIARPEAFFEGWYADAATTADIFSVEARSA